MNTPLVSVLMTVYNREKYIAQAIESVLASSYQNWELIIVDDQSKDRSVQIARTYAEKDARIKVYINEVNLGDYPNRNQAASYAKGKYLKYLDSDDLIYPHGLEVMVGAMEKFPEAGLGMHGIKREYLLPYPFCVSSENAFKQQFLGTGFFFTGPTGAIIRRDAFINVGGLSNVRYTGDFDSWLKIAAKYHVVVFQPALIWWRQHEGQEYQLGQDPSKYLKSTTEISLQHINSPGSPLNTQDRLVAIYAMKQRHSRMFLSHLVRLRVCYAMKYFRYSSLTIFDVFKGFRKSRIYFSLEDNMQ